MVRRAARNLLSAELAQRGDVLRPIVVTPELYDVLRGLIIQQASAETVFEVSGLRHGGGRNGAHAYQALNLRRELLVEKSLRTIFWLTEPEARQLPRNAPDFWAFRHQVVSLVDFQWKAGGVSPVARADRRSNT
jgi:hypothetical protein